MMYLNLTPDRYKGSHVTTAQSLAVFTLPRIPRSSFLPEPTWWVHSYFFSGLNFSEVSSSILYYTRVFKSLNACVCSIDSAYSFNCDITRPE